MIKFWFSGYIPTVIHLFTLSVIEGDILDIVYFNTTKDTSSCAEMSFVFKLSQGWGVDMWIIILFVWGGKVELGTTLKDKCY